MENEAFGSFCDPARAVRAVQAPQSGVITAGKNTYVYDAHTYHTKVPPEGIERLIERFTDAGAVVLDPFCGSGMTGIAARRTGRRALLSDLSPAATFIARNMNAPVDAERYRAAVETLLQRARPLERQLYTTTCRECGKQVPALYTVWSYRLVCSACGQEFLLWDVARDERPTVKESRIRTTFACPHCGTQLHKKQLRRTAMEPVAVGYKCCTRSLRERCCPLQADDRRRIAGITYADIPQELWYPRAAFPPGVNTRQPVSCGIDTVDKAYFPRALWAMAYLWREARAWPEPDIREKLLFTLTSLYKRVTKFSEFRFWGGSGNMANYNVPQIINEQNVFLAFERKAKTIYLYFKSEGDARAGAVQVRTQSACHLTQLADGSVDYVFTDPPFGGNINYSEMNFLWESWLQDYTDTAEEAIVNRYQHKGQAEYGALMQRAFGEIRRVLKPDGWFTMLFHNSSAAVWETLQTALFAAGFAVDGTMLFDKRHGTFKQFVSQNAVGFDLVLCCQKKQRPLAAAQHKDRSAERAEVERFLRRQLQKAGPEAYRCHFAHVHRADEFDYRKLYSEWLAEAVGREYIAIDFEMFRAITDAALQALRAAPDAPA